MQVSNPAHALFLKGEDLMSEITNGWTEEIERLRTENAALRAKIEDTEGGEKCQSCQRLYPDVYHIPDEIWKEISPKPHAVGAGLLCPKCALERLCEKHAALRESLGEFHEVVKNVDMCGECRVSSWCPQCEHTLRYAIIKLFGDSGEYAATIERKRKRVKV